MHILQNRAKLIDAEPPLLIFVKENVVLRLC